MANKFLIVLLGLAVLIQVCYATPLPDGDSKSSEENESTEDEIMKSAIVELNKVAANIVPKEVEVLKEVLKDLKGDEKRTEADDKLIQDIEKFLKEAEEEPSDALKLWFETIAIIDPTDEPGKPSKKSPKLHDLLEKHGWKNVRDDLDAQIVPKIDEFGIKVKAYYNGLSESEKKGLTHINKWIQKFDDKENDAGDKINLLLEIFVH